ncbi:MAG: fatty acid CoA ligase family protein [Myxococcota bacterium]
MPNVAEAIRAHAAARPDQPALVFPGEDYRTEAPTWQQWTFAELDRESDAYARGFVAAGVRVADRVVVLVRPSLSFYAVMLGLFKLGATPVLLDPGMGIRALLACIERTRPRVSIAAPAVHAVASTVARRSFASVETKITAGARWFWGGTTLAACRREGADPFALAERAPGDDAAILFTSGSTGSAKGVTLTQSMFRAEVASLGESFGFRPGDKDVQAFAAFAIFDLCLGHTAILPKMDYSRPATAAPADFVAAIEAHGPSITFASPIVWQNVSRYCVERGLTFPSVRTLITVGAAIPAYLHRRMQQILPPGGQVWTPYGATEGLPLTRIGTDEILGETWAKTARGAGTCVGALAPGATIRVIPIVDGPIPTWSDALALPAGVLGEIVAGGDQVSPSYKDAPEADALAKIRDGDRILHRMGDVGYLDEQGRLWFCGRKAHRVETADGSVFGADAVEGVFNEHPSVFRTALVGLGPRGRQVPVVCVEMEPGQVFGPTTEAELRALAAGTPVEGKIAAFLPHPGFPTDARHNSKIRREDLLGWASARVPAEVARAAPRG